MMATMRMILIPLPPGYTRISAHPVEGEPLQLLGEFQQKQGQPKEGS